MTREATFSAAAQAGLPPALDFRDWLRGNPGERERYAAAKRQTACAANAG